MRSKLGGAQFALVVAKACGGSVAWRSAWAMARASRTSAGTRSSTMARASAIAASTVSPSRTSRRAADGEELGARNGKRRHRISHADAHFREADLHGYIGHDPPIGTTPGSGRRRYGR